MTAASANPWVYVGSYTRLEPYPRGRAEGIAVFRLDPATGALTLLQTAGGALNPSFLALDPTRRFLYAVNGVPEIDGHPGGAVSAYAVDRTTGTLTFLNRESCLGSGPSHVSVDRTGQYVFVAMYHGGSVAMLPIQSDGRLGPATDFHQLSGSSVNPARQDRPHPHSANVDLANRFVLVPDLGQDKILVYRLDLARGKLVPNDPPWATARPGAGPRHLAFHPSGRYAYVINEIDSTIGVYAYNGSAGALDLLQVVSTLPSDFAGENTGAEVRVTASGRFVYGSNRGHDSLAGFAVDEATGRLTPIGFTPTGGTTPRNFTIDDADQLVLAANQDSDTLVAFHLDARTGHLIPTGQVTPSPTPTCVRIRSAG